MAKKQTDNEIIDQLVTAAEGVKAAVKEAPAPIVLEEEVKAEIKKSFETLVNSKVGSMNPQDAKLIEYHKRGRTVNQLAGMFMISEAEVRKILDENV